MKDITEQLAQSWDISSDEAEGILRPYMQFLDRVEED